MSARGCFNYSTSLEAECVLDEGHAGVCRYEHRVMLAAFAATLASNLAVAGALCKAFGLGYEIGGNATIEWWPGCGRTAP